jgi:AcrR family transcriptional regulator
VKPKVVGPAPRRLLNDERRQQLLALGRELFGQRPYDGVSIDEIARLAGISKGLVYHYFPTKRDFYVATVQEAARVLVETVNPNRSLLPVERLERGLDAFLDYVERHAVAYAALLRSGVGADPEAAEIVDATREHFARLVMEGILVEDPPPLVRAALRGWIGLVEAATLDWAERRDLDRQKLKRLLAESAVTIMQRVVSLL